MRFSFTELMQTVSLRGVLSFYLTLFVPLFYLFNLLVIARYTKTFSVPTLIVLIGIILTFIGLALWIVSMVHLGKSFGVLPRKQKKIRRGIYKHLNHPMYIGIVATFVGLGLANQSRQGLLTTIFVLVPLLIVRAYFEEKKLV